MGEISERRAVRRLCDRLGFGPAPGAGSNQFKPRSIASPSTTTGDRMLSTATMKRDSREATSIARVSPTLRAMLSESPTMRNAVNTTTSAISHPDAG